MSDQPYAPARSSSLGIPVAIVIAAGLIAGAIIFTGSQGRTATVPPTAQPTTPEAPEANVPPASADDHILGNPNAPVMIVEYSDYDCPYCKLFHETMKTVMAEFSESGDVAWTYRHFPIAGLHPNAPKLAEASECVAELGGNDAFWKFSDSIFTDRETNSGTDMALLPLYAEQAGADKAAFESCLAGGKYTAQIADDIQAAAAAGARGTPYSVILAGDQKIVINGAEPYETVKAKVQAALAQ